LFDAVVARFTLDGTEVSNVFGWRESPKKIVTGNRIAWIPGDEGGALGEMGPARNPGGNARSLGTLGELFTVEIVAYDHTSPTDEKAQYKAARFLFDAWYRAVYLAARGTFDLVSSEWIRDKKELRAGAGIRVVCSIQALIPDTQYPYAPEDVRADVDVLELNALEPFVTPWNVRVATTEPIVLNGLSIVDGVALAQNDRVLVKDQALPANNSVYLASSSAWTRVAELDTSAEVVNGLSFAVNDGTENKGAEFELTTPNPITLGTTGLTFSRKA
jgi:hypothetical protein